MTEASAGLERSLFAEHRHRRLQQLLATVLAHNPFYRAKLNSAGITDAAQVSSLAHYRDLPLTTKQELSEDQLSHPPFGTNLSEPLANYVRLHQTSGTRGTPLRWLDTAESWRWWAGCWKAVYDGAGVRADDRIFFAFSFGPFIGFWSAMAGAEAIGALAIPGGGMSSEQRLHNIIEMGATVLVSTPTYALHLAEQANRCGIDIAASSIRLTIHAGEPGAGIEATRARIESAWGARCFDHAGATEVGAWGFECGQRAGMHINEDEFLCEVIDPSTGEPSEQGELVITNLGRSCMPVIRYRTGDHVRLERAACACGRRSARCIGGVLGRVDDAIIVRGVNVFPSAIENIVRRYEDVGEFQVEVFRRDELDELILRVELIDTARAPLIAADIRRQLGLRVAIEVVPPQSLPRYELKARRFLAHQVESGKSS